MSGKIRKGRVAARGTQDEDFERRTPDEWLEYWKEERMKWYLSLGMRKEKLRFRKHRREEMAHYARAAWDIEYESPFGWREFEGIHHRGDWDLARHAKFSGKDLTYFDEEIKERYIPWVIETSGGVDRAALFFLIDAYNEEKGRVVLKLHPKLAPIKVAVFPLLANKEDLVRKARQVYLMLKSRLSTMWDERGNIGKRYYSQDEIGTPWCVTIDHQTLQDDMVTVRDRDTTEQQRVKISRLAEYFNDKLAQA
ncbi:MAG: His/Gly/Thr/Pro-type tRNA ligase C-terminal domain-containing protein [Candidatus Paceibacteria bacterium]